MCCVRRYINVPFRKQLDGALVFRHAPVHMHKTVQCLGISQCQGKNKQRKQYAR